MCVGVRFEISLTLVTAMKYKQSEKTYWNDVDAQDTSCLSFLGNRYFFFGEEKLFPIFSVVYTLITFKYICQLFVYTKGKKMLLSLFSQ